MERTVSKLLGSATQDASFRRYPIVTTRQVLPLIPVEEIYSQEIAYIPNGIGSQDIPPVG
jgi:hypothetical protein